MVFGQARDFVDVNPKLSAVFETQRYAIACRDVRGVIRRVAADGKMQHGLNPSGIVIDELHAFQTPRQVELYAALTTATGAREQPLTVAITTAGYDLDTILGRLYQEALHLPNVERLPGLTIARDEASGFLMYWFAAPEDAPIDDEDAWMAANPASWVTCESLRAQLESPTVSENEFRRLHLNQWTKAQAAWLPVGTWPALRVESNPIPDDRPVYAGVDVGISYDTTALVLAWRRDDGRVGLAAEVWAVDDRAQAHHHLTGSRFDLEIVEDRLRGLAGQLQLAEVVYDPRFFERSAQVLSDEGLVMGEFAQNSAEMADAYQDFYTAARSGKLAHDGDPVFAAHVEAAAADETERGWRVRKMKATQRIDACVAAVMAAYRAQEPAFVGGIDFG